MNWIKRVVFSSLVILLSSVIGLASVESVLYFLKKEISTVAREANILINFEFEYDISQLYVSDLESVTYKRDKYGLRDNCLSVEDIKILAIGGSTTDQRYVSYESTYPKIIQDRLNSEIGSFGCVSNAGIDGHSTWGHIYSFENWFPLIPNLSPTYVILYIGVNDANFRFNNGPNEFDLNQRKDIKNWLKNFEIINHLMPIYRYLKQLKQKVDFSAHQPTKYSRDDYVVDTLNSETKALALDNSAAFRTRLKLLLSKVRGIGSIPICVTQPHRYVRSIDGKLFGIPSVLGEDFSGIDYDYSLRSINTILQELCEGLLLDLYSYDFADEHFYDGVHTTESGSILIGNLMADFLIENNLQLNLLQK